MKILNSLGINEVFSDIFDIKKSYYFPKPMKKSMNKLIKEYNLKPEKTVYFEDLNKNLKYAYSLGITTVHISNNIHTSNPSSRLLLHTQANESAWTWCIAPIGYTPSSP